ncbi:unnamed protein product [Paramecium pentaurelia]|uniref:ABC transporter family protein n=1 Tax=Paramecium pentaurelia TaxID=43138 RepID=A0A8S1YFY3_9CILI|nr:unnamed protein product [Paramecium pentaurelia]
MLTIDSSENAALSSRRNITEKAIQTNIVSYWQLFRFSTKKDKIFMLIGSFAALLNGVAYPGFSILIGDMTESFSREGDQMVEEAGKNAMQNVFSLIDTQQFLLLVLLQCQQQCLRPGQYLENVKEIGWFDTINPNELSNKVANETFLMQCAIGEKVPTFIMTLAETLFGFSIGYIYGWQLALVVTSTLPVISVATAIFSIILQASENKTSTAFQEAGALAEQAINAIKTVKMFDGEDLEVSKYKQSLNHAIKMKIRYSLGVALAFGFLQAAMVWAYALGFWYGAKLISDQTINHNTGEVYKVGDVMIIFYAILTGGFSLGQVGPCIQNFGKGRQAATQMFAVLDRIPKISNPTNQIQLNNFNGEIQLKNIYFSYPNQSEQFILKGLNLHIPAGKKVALVGPSGCGKSTVIQLIERFYDCDSGEIVFGNEKGINIKDLNLIELRNIISLVGQEPVLFATSIRENLLYGKIDATDEELIDALKQVNAWDFVSKLEKGLETYVGIGGSQLSGGQKQRIAIARAILKKPKVLLLDEATSALDRTNEKLIQETLDTISNGITTIIVAHRLSTIQNADLIYVIDKGIVIENGSHNELMKLQGVYYQLACNQMNIEEEELELEQLSSCSSDNRIQVNSINSQRSLQIRMNGFNLQNIAYALKEEIQRYQVEEIKDEVQQNHNKHHHHKHIQVEQNNQHSKISEDVSIYRLFQYIRNEKLQLFVGIIAALLNGSTFPIFSLFLAELITILIQSNPQFTQDYCDQQGNNLENDFCNTTNFNIHQELKQQTDQLTLWFFIIGLFVLVLWTIQMYFLTYVGEKLSFRLRLDAYRKLIRMPIPYYDIPKNNAGTLTTRLSVDCKVISGVISSILGINISNLGVLISGLVISFVASWQMTLIMIGLSPLSYLGSVLQAKFLYGFSYLTDEAYKDSCNIIMEAVNNIRTVQSFGKESAILDLYANKVQLPLQQANKKAFYIGFAFGFSQMQMFIINAVIFYVGALMCRDGVISVKDLFTSIQAITFATMSAADNAAFAGDVGVVKKAIKNIFDILDDEDEFQKQNRLKRKQLKLPLHGDIHFENLSFKYPGRDKNVFSNLNLIVKQYQKVAFVGSSGCGKSTLMQMLMRFYEPDQGVITINNIDINDYDIKYLRNQFGIVSQEPVLFNATIKENIQYNLESATIEEIKSAAKKANAYDFIISNFFDEKSGFSRQVGPKGSQISGGQKQRIAIARVILRNPNFLLLDEPTSALDAASEQLVSESLQNFTQNKTTISIAHRISTIQHSDVIYVFEDGKIVEQGDYQTLSNLKKVFFRLEQGIKY